MMKKKTLKLNELKVKSFLTLEDGKVSQTVKGGFRDDINVSPRCGPSAATICPDCPDEIQ